jgi:hypothetical protein
VTWVKRLFLVLLLIGAPASGGCGKTPQVDGRWRGKLVAVTVADHRGREYDASAVEIMSGPRLPYDVPDRDAGRVPLLVRDRRGPSPLILDPEGLPVGAFVEVRGTLIATGAYAPEPTDRHAVAPLVSLGAATGPIILLRGDPKVVRE